MHNATEAALELRRCVTELGFLGALLNDYQQSGADNSKPLLSSHYNGRAILRKFS